MDLSKIALALNAAYATLYTLARQKGHEIKALTINVTETNLDAGRVVGTVTVANRSRRPFTLTAKPESRNGCSTKPASATVEFMGLSQAVTL